MMKVVMNNVESLGSGIPRILRAYGEDCFKFTDNFIRITLPITAHEGTKSALSRNLVGTQLIVVKKGIYNISELANQSCGLVCFELSRISSLFKCRYI